MQVRISYALSKETRPEYEAALAKVQKKKDKNRAKVVDVEIQEVAPGQFAGVIVLEVSV